MMAEVQERGPRELPQEVLDEIVRRIVEVARPQKIVLFGSAARGAMGPDSDADFLVITGGTVHRRRLAGEIHMNLFGVGCATDIVVVTAEDVEKYRDSWAYVIRPALEDGRVVYAA